MQHNYKDHAQRKELAAKLQLLNEEIQKIGEAYKQIDASIEIAHMYNYLVLKDRVLFGITHHCTSVELENKIKETAAKILY